MTIGDNIVSREDKIGVEPPCKSARKTSTLCAGEEIAPGGIVRKTSAQSGTPILAPALVTVAHVVKRGSQFADVVGDVNGIGGGGNGVDVIGKNVPVDIGLLAFRPFEDDEFEVVVLLSDDLDGGKTTIGCS